MADLPEYTEIHPALADHPLFSGSSSVGMISGENPRWLNKLPYKQQENIQKWGHQMLSQDLKNMGLRHEETEGRYGSPEKSYIVYNPTKEQMIALGNKYGQDSILHVPNGHKSAKIHYTDLAQDEVGNLLKGYSRPSTGSYAFSNTEQPEDYYTKLPGKGYMRLNFDWDKPPTKDNGDITKKEVIEGLLGVLKKVAGPSVFTSWIGNNTGNPSLHNKRVSIVTNTNEKERVEGLNHINSKAISRVRDGDKKEFLLHREMGQEEGEKYLQGDRYNNQQDKRIIGNKEFTPYTSWSLKPISSSKVPKSPAYHLISAWVPEESIAAYVPSLVALVGNKLKNKIHKYTRADQEVVVHPGNFSVLHHTSSVSPMHDGTRINHNKEVDAKVGGHLFDNYNEKFGL